MAGVKVVSGPIEATDLPRHIPRERMRDLVAARKRFLAQNLTYDCRCLVQFIKDADEVYEPAGFPTPDDLIRQGYELDPEEIALAVRWLELNEPESATPLPVAVEGGRAAKAAELAQTVPAAAPAKGGGQSGNKNASKNKVNDYENSSPCLQKGHATPRRVARLKRDHPEVAERLARGEFKSVAAAERASRGEEPHPPRRMPTALELLRRIWQKATPEDRAAFLKEVSP